MSNRRNLNKDNEPSLKIHIEPRGAYLEENFSSLARNCNQSSSQLKDKSNKSITSDISPERREALDKKFKDAVQKQLDVLGRRMSAQNDRQFKMLDSSNARNKSNLKLISSNNLSRHDGRKRIVSFEHQALPNTTSVKRETDFDGFDTFTSNIETVLSASDSDDEGQVVNKHQFESEEEDLDEFYQLERQIRKMLVQDDLKKKQDREIELTEKAEKKLKEQEAAREAQKSKKTVIKAQATTNIYSETKLTYRFYVGRLHESFKYAQNSFSNGSTVTRIHQFMFYPGLLLRQFGKLINFYFLIVTLLWKIFFHEASEEYPFYGMLLNFVVSIIIQMVKEFIDEVRMKPLASFYNRRETKRFNYGDMGFETYNWEDLKVGEVIKVVNGEEVPADVLLVSADSQIALLDESQLDGDAILKHKYCAIEKGQFEDHELNFKALLYCQEPNDRLDDWQAQIRIGLQDIIDISINNLCMKGSFVRGNKYIIGIVIYVGKDVKKVLGNKEITTGLLRKQLSNNIVVMLIIIGILSLILGCCRVLWLVSSQGALGYLKNRTGVDQSIDNQSFINLDKIDIRSVNQQFLQLVIGFIGFSLRYANMLPVTLLACIGILEIKLTYKKKEFTKLKLDQINQGKNLVSAKAIDQVQDEGITELMRPLIVTKLGKIDLVLTESEALFEDELVLKTIFIQGLDILYNQTEELNELQENNELVKEAFEKDPAKIFDFMTGLVLCNDITVTRKERLVGQKLKHEKKFFNTTKEDIIMLATAKTFGVIIQNKIDNEVFVKIQKLASNETGKDPRLSYDVAPVSKLFSGIIGGLQETIFGHIDPLRMFKIKAIFPFDQSRKKESIIFKTFSGQYVLYCKSRDLKNFPPEIVSDDLWYHFKESTRLGHRSTIIAMRKIERSDYLLFKGLQRNFYRLAQTMISNIYKSFEEQGLQVLGIVTAQDTMQKNVVESVGQLQDAGIKFWLIKNGNLEQAKNAAEYLKLAEDPDALKVDFIAQDEEEFSDKIDDLQDLLSNVPIDLLIIDGPTFAIALQELTLERKLFQMLCNCKAVIFTNMTPFQKAKIASITTNKFNIKVLAVGVNHYDSLMLTEAEVGVRMVRKINTNAGPTSHDADVVVNRFSQVPKLILDYGYNSYRTQEKFMYLFIYRLSAIVFMELYFQFFCAFSFQQMRIPEIVFLNMYIITPILLTITAYYDLQKEGICATPTEYKRFLSESDQQFAKILKSLCYSIWHSSVVVFPMIFIMREQGVFFSLNKDRSNAAITMHEMSTICIHNIQIIFYIKLMLTYSNKKNVIPILMAHGSLHAIIFILSREIVAKAKGYEDLNLWIRCFGNLTFWVVFFFTIWTAVSVNIAENIINKVLNQDHTLEEAKKLTRQESIRAGKLGTKPLTIADILKR